MSKVSLWGVSHGTRLIERNISNATNSTSCPAGVDTTLPLLNTGGAPFESDNVRKGKLEFDPLFNGGKGGIITERISRDAHFEVRLTWINTGAANTEAVFKIFLGDDLGNPASGIFINSSPIPIKSEKEQTIPLSFFGNKIKVIYPVVNPDNATTINLRGMLISAWENP